MRAGVVFAPSQYNVFERKSRHKTIYPTASLENPMSVKRLGVYDMKTNALAESIFDAEGVSKVERMTLGERVNLRSDLPTPKRVSTYGRRADNATLPTVRVESFDDIITAGKKAMTLEVTKYRRSTMNIEAEDKSRVSRKGHHTSLQLTSKESMLCPICECGLIHPKTFACNGGHPTDTRCGQSVDVDAYDITIVVMHDVANRYEPKVKMPHFGIENGELVFNGNITLTRRGGSDKAQNNAEKWMTSRRRVKGGKPSWGSYNVEGGSFRSGMISLEAHIDGKVFTTFATIAFDESDIEAMTNRGVTIQSRGVNLFDREVTE